MHARTGPVADPLEDVECAAAPEQATRSALKNLAVAIAGSCTVDPWNQNRATFRLVVTPFLV
jgi:hypothetical protein